MLFPTLFPRWTRPWVARAARLMPLDTPAGCMAGSLLVLFGAACLMPHLLEAVRLAAEAARLPPTPAVLYALEAAWGFAAAGALLLFQARCLQLCHPGLLENGDFRPRRSRGRPVATVAEVPLSHDDLCTSVLVTGVTGSSKTAGILLPLLAQLLAACDGRRREKLGAFIPEVKGDLVDAAIHLARAAGRDVAREVIVLSPSSRLPVVRYRDEQGRQWFLAGRGGAGGSDAGDWLPPPASCPFGPDALEDADHCGEALAAWSRHTLEVGRRQPRFVGWRWEGGSLRRIGGGRAAKQTPPRRLTAEAVEYIDNGAHYNLVDPRLPAAETAERLCRLAAMARGPVSRGENDYFYEQGRKLLAACLTLLRTVAPTPPPTLVAVMRCVTQEDELESLLLQLEARAAAGEEQHRDLIAYFRGEWLRMVADGKTATVIRSTLTASFDPFLHDPALAETFCQPSTFSFADIAQEGKIIGFVPGERYEQLGRLLGTACKLDFQAAMLGRTSRPGMNTRRLAVYFADECHKYAAAGSATAGDPYFMNLSRSNQVVNVCATQSYAWLVEVLGREAANVYIAAFGVQYWLQQTDPETCRRAAEICGSIAREKISTEHDLNWGGIVDALGSARPLAIRRRRQEEDAARFRAEDFALLDVGEVIGFNKGLPGRTEKVRRSRVRYLPCTRPPAGPRAIQASVREYYRELLENLAADRGRPEQWSCTGLDAEAEFASYVGPPTQAPT